MELSTNSVDNAVENNWEMARRCVARYECAFWSKKRQKSSLRRLFKAIEDFAPITREERPATT
jgi:hypothetical protein